MAESSCCSGSACKREETDESKPKGKCIKIRGTPVDFCYQPYGVQITMMDQALRAITKQTNCLIESPTGSGKTLALLSSTLAWQKAEEERIRTLRAQRAEVLRLEHERATYELNGGREKTVPTDCMKTPGFIDVTDDADDFMTGPPCSKMAKMEEYSPVDEGKVSKSKVPLIIKQEEEPTSFQKNDDPIIGATTSTTNKDQSGPDIALTDSDPEKREKLPKIFYGTRTHKQIAHVISELNKTQYADVLYTILGSREQGCVHPDVSTKPDKNTLCHELLTPGGLGCTYYSQLKRNYENKPTKLRKDLSPAALADSGIQKLVWDMEDLVQISKSMHPRNRRFCPFYASRVLLADAQLVICPYNYLLEPLIRNTMSINLSDQVVILDEAHNIEDVCRDSASFTFTLKQVEAAALNFRELRMRCDGSMMSDGEAFEAAELMSWRENLHDLHEFAFSIIKWFRSLEGSPKIKPSEHRSYGSEDGDLGVGLWDGLEVAASLRTQMQVPPHTSEQCRVLQESLKVVSSDEFGGGDSQKNRAQPEGEDEENQANVLPKPAVSSLNVVEAWLQIMQFFNTNEDKYKLCVTLVPSRESLTNYDPNSLLTTFASGYTQQTQTGASRRDHDLKIEFWCMDPSIAFSSALKDSRSVLLASGTLCPLETFRTELGVPFDGAMEGAHVVHKQNVFTAALSKGPEDVTLRGTYRETNSDEFRDEFGRLLWHVCNTVPGGVLCFFSSYRLMSQLVEHWQRSGVWTSIASRKVIVEEPRDGREMSAVMDTYLHGIASPTYFGAAVNGSLMLAIYRGKVSEGADFTDDMARAVITVGIPYPSIRDLNVEQKRAWNDRMRVVTEKDPNRTILSGKRWYEIQAFRALNQALGRCIRHKNDWGAIILVDSRFLESGYSGNNSYLGSVSKWIRQSLRSYDQFNPFITDLAEFVDRMKLTAPPSTPLALMKFSTPKNPVTKQYKKPRTSGSTNRSKKNTSATDSPLSSKSNKPQKIHPIFL